MIYNKQLYSFATKFLTGIPPPLRGEPPLSMGVNVLFPVHLWLITVSASVANLTIGGLRGISR